MPRLASRANERIAGSGATVAVRVPGQPERQEDGQREGGRSQRAPGARDFHAPSDLGPHGQFREISTEESWKLALRSVGFARSTCIEYCSIPM